jgi:PhzF family phenazine biosynthesis protein
LNATITQMRTHSFTQVNVFSSSPLGGNPLAVVHAADDLQGDQMAAIARWTHLSETTFILAPTDPAADYRVRIFTPERELPFAGHPTLGSCHAWLAAGGKPRAHGPVVQQCAAGLVKIALDGPRLEFMAPALLRTGGLDRKRLLKISRGLSLEPHDIVRHQWVDNGPGWCAVMLRSASEVLAIQPDWDYLESMQLGVIGPHEADHDAAFEVRAFIGDAGGYEDPVTGSLNASLAQWMFASGLAKSAYIAAQGTALNREGRVHLRQDGSSVWVGGLVQTVIEGSIGG